MEYHIGYFFMDTIQSAQSSFSDIFQADFNS